MHNGLLKVFNVDLVLFEKDVFDDKNLNCLHLVWVHLSRQKLLLAIFHLIERTFESLSEDCHRLLLIIGQAFHHFRLVHI